MPRTAPTSWRDTMARYLFVVARAHSELYEVLKAQFMDDPNVTVVLDRRVAQRRVGPEGGAREWPSERRRISERRVRPSVDEELRFRSHAIVTVEDYED